MNVYFNPKLSHNRKGTLEHTKASKQNHYLHREHVFRSYVIETRELMLRYYNFQFKSALYEVWGTLETFHRAGHPIADFKSSFKSGLWNFGWFWFLKHNCLLFAKYEEVGWLVQEYSFWDFVQTLCQKHETSLSHSYKSYLTGLCICCWMRCKIIKWIDLEWSILVNVISVLKKKYMLIYVLTLVASSDI